MELTVEIIMAVATAIVTAFAGSLVKRFHWATEDYIPYQNIIIGVVSGILCFVTGLIPNIITALILGVFSATASGGIYDATKTKKNY